MSKVFTALVVGLVLVTVVGAADKIDISTIEQKTLPAEVYDRLTPGKRTSLLWRDATFVMNSPYEIDKVEWLASDRNGTLLDYLSKQLHSLEQKGAAQYQVDARVTKYVPASIKSFGKNVQPLFIVEISVADKTGKLVAAMVTAEKGDLGRHPKADSDTFNGMVDKVIAAFDSEVMKGR